MLCLGFFGMAWAEPLEVYAPENVMFALYLGSANIDQDPQTKEAWNHPEIQDAKKMFQQMFDAAMELVPGDPQAKAQIREYIKLLEHEMLLVFAATTDLKDPPCALILSNPKVAQERIKGIFSMLNLKYQKVSLFQMDAEKWGTPGREIYGVALENRYILSLSKIFLKELSKIEKPLAQSVHFLNTRAVAQDTDTKPYLYAYVNVEEMLNYGKQAFQKSQQGSELHEFERALAQFYQAGEIGGYSNCKAIWFSAKQQKATKAQLMVWNPGKPTGAFQLLDFSGGDPNKLIRYAQIAPVQSITYAYVNLGQYWSKLKGLLSQVNPPTYEELQRNLAEMEKAIGWKLEDDVLNPVAGEMIQATFAAPLKSAGFLFVALNDPAKFQESLDKAMQLALIEHKTIVYKGKTVHYVTVPVRELQKLLNMYRYDPHPAAIAQYYLNTYLNFNPCFFVEDNVLIASNLVQNLKDYIDYREANSSVTQALPIELKSSHCLASWEESKQSSLYWYNTFLPLLYFIEGPIREWGIPFDASRLPSAAAMQNLFGPSQFVWEVTDQGMQFRAEFHSAVGSPMMLLSVTGVAAALLLPALGAVQEKAKRAKCMSNLSQLGRLLQLYRMDYGKLPPLQNPDFFVVLYESKFCEPDLFVSPMSGRTPPTPEQIKAKQADISDYEVRTKPLRSLYSQTSSTMLVWSKEGIHSEGRTVLFLDGHVEFIREAEFLRLLEKMNKE